MIPLILTHQSSLRLQALVSVSTIGTRDELSDAELEATVRREAAEWFGADSVSSWRHLRTYRIPFAQPNQVRWGREEGELQSTAGTGEDHLWPVGAADRWPVSAAKLWVTLICG